MPPDGMCLWHCLSFAMAPSEYDNAEQAENGAFVGPTSKAFYDKARDTRFRVIQSMIDNGKADQAKRLEGNGVEGCACEETSTQYAKPWDYPSRW